MRVKLTINRWRRERLAAESFLGDPNEAIHRLLVALVSEALRNGFTLLELVEELEYSPLEWVRTEYLKLAARR